MEVSYNPLQTYGSSASDNMPVSSLTTYPHIQGDSRGRLNILGGGCIGHFLLNLSVQHTFPPLTTSRVFPLLPCRHCLDQLFPRFHRRGYHHLLLKCFNIQTLRRLRIMFPSYYKTSRFMFVWIVCGGFLKIKLSEAMTP